MGAAKYVYFNGNVVPWQEARVHIFSPVAKYGIGVFEGIRGYWNAEAEEMYLFRLQEHMRRLDYAQAVMRFETPVPGESLIEPLIDLVRANQFRETIHARVQIYLDGAGDVSAVGPVGVAITAIPRPLPKQVSEGVSAQVSSWIRISDRSMPARVKCNANYHNGRLAMLQARHDGYRAPILLNMEGKVSEGPSMCLFIVREGRPITPAITNDVLESITRRTVLELARAHLGVEPCERDVDRSELYAAEEAFFCGTGWEVTPIVSIDGLPIGSGRAGPFVRRLQKLYFDVVEGRRRDHAHWRTPVYRSAPSGTEASTGA
jgi:branched-chain amino acid aminotransferase